MISFLQNYNISINNLKIFLLKFNFVNKYNFKTFKFPIFLNFKIFFWRSDSDSKKNSH